jgi:hypothetical protein
VAIQKKYLSRFGYNVPEAYFKVDSYINNGLNDYTFYVKIYINESHRFSHPDKALTVNKYKLSINPQDFNNDLTEDENLKTICYNYLKALTKSFINDSIDV